MDTSTPDLMALCDALAQALKRRGWMMATAESCTGGLIAGVCTGLSGSSDWFERGYITYSNAAKSADLGVSAALIDRCGAVSQPVVEAMAAGARQRAGVHAALAVTGVAGPTGGSPDKPVGLVWFGWATPQGVVSERQLWPGDRDAVRRATVQHALAGLLRCL